MKQALAICWYPVIIMIIGRHTDGVGGIVIKNSVVQATCRNMSQSTIMGLVSETSKGAVVDNLSLCTCSKTIKQTMVW